MKYYLLAFKNYATFNGRSNRSEYWYFVLFNFIFAILAMSLDSVFGTAFDNNFYGFIYLAYLFITLLPGLSVSVRRLHDTNKSGWWTLILFIPFIGSLWLLIIMAGKGTDGENKYGPDPNGSITFDFESQTA